MNSFKNQKTATPRSIGQLAAFTIVAGSMLGVGIFLFPAPVAAEVNSLGLFFLVWLVGGLIALSGASACGELGAMLPQAGGDYVFQREAFGPSMAFAGGWVLFGAIFCGSIAAMAVALFQYQVSTLIGFDLMTSTGILNQMPFANLLAVALIISLTLVNTLGTRLSMWIQVILTLVPVVALLIIGIFALSNNPMTGLPVPSAKPDSFSLQGLVTALLYVNFAYSGWISIVYIAGEVKKPGKNIPRAMFRGTFAIILIYMFLTATFVFTLGYDKLASLYNIDAGTALAGVMGSKTIGIIVTLTIGLAIITSLNASILAGSRVAYAMARDGAFWKGASKLSKIGVVPRRALWFQAAIAIILVLTGSFNAIIEMTSIAMFITGSITVTSLFVLRRSRPLAARPYRSTGYPWLPAIYLAFSLIALGVTAHKALTGDNMKTLFPFLGVGILIVAFTGHKLYSIFKQKRTPF